MGKFTLLQEKDSLAIETKALIALGSNLSSDAGGPEDTIRSGLEMLEEQGVRPCVVSRFFKTPCFPAGAGPDFVNVTASVMCNLSPTELLTVLHRVESLLGRLRQVRWGARTLDIDLIAVEDSVIPDRETFRAWADLPLDRQSDMTPDQLILPHPRMQDRAFVLIPLAEVAADWRHPVLGLTVTEMVQNLSETDRNAVKPL